MDERGVMEDLLNITKGTCDLYMHGAIESSSGDVNQAFNNALNEALKMQTDIYAKMASKGWYSMNQAQPQQIQQVKQKYSAQA